MEKIHLVFITHHEEFTMQAFHRLVVRRACGAIVALAQILPAAAAGNAQQEAFARAASDFRAQRFAAAYGQFMRLADAGHVPSAGIALLMFREGHALFRTPWDATPDQERHWADLSIRAVRRSVLLQD